LFFASGLLLYQASICDTVLYENHVVHETNKPSGVAVAILSDNSRFKLVIGQAAVNTRSQAEKRRWFHEVRGFRRYKIVLNGIQEQCGKT
jgi:hypothetical protein